MPINTSLPANTKTHSLTNEPPDMPWKVFISTFIYTHCLFVLPFDSHLIIIAFRGLATCETFIAISYVYGQPAKLLYYSWASKSFTATIKHKAEQRREKKNESNNTHTHKKDLAIYSLWTNKMKLPFSYIYASWLSVYYVYTMSASQPGEPGWASLLWG